MSTRIRNLFLLGCLGVLLGFLWLLPVGSPVAAQSITNLSSRVSRLESENSALRSRLLRLETQVSRNGRPPVDAISQPPPPSEPMRGTLSSDPMFDRLATLAIEQKERMDRLEARLAALEERLPQR